MVSYKEKIKQLIFKEMAVVDKTKTKLPIDIRVNNVYTNFKQMFSSLKNLNKPPFWFGMHPVNNKDISLLKKVIISVGGSFDFNGMYKGQHYGYYEANRQLAEMWNKFRNSNKGIKIKWKQQKPKFENHSGLLDDTTNASFSMIGTVILSEIIIYMVDKNINKKIKLGTYPSKYEAENDIGGMVGVASNDNEIYYWGRNINSKTYKTFDNFQDTQKYLKNIEIVIEEVER